MRLTIDEMRAKRDDLKAELAELRSRPANDGTAERIRNIATGLARLDDELGDAERRRARVAELAKRPENRESGDGAGGPRGSDSRGLTAARRRTMTDNSPLAATRDAAHRAVDGMYERGALPERAGYHLTDLIDRDKFGLDSAYIEAVSSPAYEMAFSKQLTTGGASAVLEADEAEAMQRVGRSMAQRAMAVGEGATGGFAVPASLDPTVLLTNDGAVNPIRELATVSTITTNKWQGVASAGVEAEFAAEAAEAEDGSPELSQPEITPERASIWVPYSAEVGMDWPGLAAELGKLFADAKSVKEAEVFATGKGEESIPQGLITGATKLVETATKEVVVAADIYSLQEKLAPRWSGRATWLGANKVANQIHKFVAKGDTEEAALMSENRDAILGKPFREVSTMSAKTTTKNEKVLAYGDIGSAYRIVDRLGLTVEPVAHVFGENQRPTGQRGLFAWFRVGAKVVIGDAVQVLKIKE